MESFTETGGLVRDIRLRKRAATVQVVRTLRAESGTNRETMPCASARFGYGAEP